MSCGVGPGGVVETLPGLVIVCGREASIQVRLVGVLEDGLVPLSSDAVVHNVRVVVHVQGKVGKRPVDDAAIRSSAISTHASHRIPDW